MVQIVGQYKQVSYAPNYESYLRAVGVPEPAIPIALNQKPILTISENNGQWTFHYSDGGKEWSSTFKLGEPFDEAMFNGDFVKSLAKREGDKLIIESTVKNAEDCRVFEFNDTGITVTSNRPKANATTSSVWKRL